MTSGPLLVVRASMSTHVVDLHDGPSHQYHDRPHCFLATDHLGCRHLHALHHESGEVVVPLHPDLRAVALLVGRAITPAKG